MDIPIGATMRDHLPRSKGQGHMFSNVSAAETSLLYVIITCHINFRLGGNCNCGAQNTWCTL